MTSLPGPRLQGACIIMRCGSLPLPACPAPLARPWFKKAERLFPSLAKRIESLDLAEWSVTSSIRPLCGLEPTQAHDPSPNANAPAPPRNQGSIKHGTLPPTVPPLSQYHTARDRCRFAETNPQAFQAQPRLPCGMLRRNDDPHAFSRPTQPFNPPDAAP